jgi:hypothetical protein
MKSFKSFLLKRKELTSDKNLSHEFKTEKGSTYKIYDKGLVYRKKYNGIKSESDSISYVTPENYKKIINIPKKFPNNVILIKHLKNSIIFEINGSPIAEFESTSYPEINLHPIDSKNGYVHIGHKIIEIIK